jgi:hypothetical protein
MRRKTGAHDGALYSGLLRQLPMLELTISGRGILPRTAVNGAIWSGAFSGYQLVRIHNEQSGLQPA